MDDLQASLVCRSTYYRGRRLKFTFQGDAHQRLDTYLSQEAGISRTKAEEAIESGAVLVDGKPETRPSTKLRPGVSIELRALPNDQGENLEPAPIELDIVFEDEWILVIDKPRGLAVHPAPTLREPSLVNAILHYGGTYSTFGGDFRPGIVHRLDKETTGLIVVARNDSVHGSLAEQFAKRTAGRKYLGVVLGSPAQERFDIDAPIGRDPKNRQRMAAIEGGRHAVTHCKVLGRSAVGTTIGFKLATGRTHQIRVHMKAIGHPILGDRTYAPPVAHGLPLQLHAAILSFDHPVSGQRLEFSAAPPGDFVGVEGALESLLATVF